MRHPRARWTCPAPAVLSMLLLPALTGNASCQAQEKANVLPETQAGREIVVELEELGPIKRNRQIHTTNLHVLFRMKSFEIGDFKLYGGLTVSRARGTISYRTGSFEAGTLRDESLDSNASGAGPVLAARVELARSGNVSASLDGHARVLRAVQAQPVLPAAAFPVGVGHRVGGIAGNQSQLRGQLQQGDVAGVGGELGTAMRVSEHQHLHDEFDVDHAAAVVLEVE